MPDTPLNPDALEVAARATYEMRNPESWARTWEELEPEEREEEWVKPTRTSTLAYLAVAQPEVNSVEELAQLPIGSAVLSEKYIAQQEAEEYPCVFQKLYTGDWHRGGRSSDTHPDYFLPARVLYRPEVTQ